MSYLEMGLAAGFLLTALGCVLGFTDKIVVFRNYDDLGLAFLGVVPVFIGFISMVRWILIPAAIISCAVFMWLLVRTWQDNQSVWKLLVALPTKLALSVLFIAFLWDVLSPNGQTQIARAKQRGLATAVLAVLTPVIYRLVREKTGVIHPKQAFHGTRRGLTRGS